MSHGRNARAWVDFWRWVLSLCLCAVVLSGVDARAAVPDPTRVTIGVLAYLGKPQTLARWQPTAEFLTQDNPGYRFVIEPLFLNELAAAVKEDRLDFVLTQPLQFVELADEAGIWPLATMDVAQGGQKLDRFGSAVIVRADRQDLNHLADLRGKLVAGASPDALGAWLLGIEALSRAGIAPKTEIQPVFTGLPMMRVVQAVLDGRADAGIVRAGFIEHLVADGTLAADQLRVIGRKQYNDFPYAVSTELVPEWPFSATTRANRALARKVGRQLLGMSADSPAAEAAGVASWSLPLDYAGVQEIRAKWLPKSLSLTAVLRVYGLWLLLPVGLVIFLFYRQGRRVQRQLLQQETQLRTTLNALHDAVVVLSTSGRVLFVNTPTLALLRHPVDRAEVLHGRHFTLLFDLRWPTSLPGMDLRQALALLESHTEDTYEVQLHAGHQIRDIDLNLRRVGALGAPDTRIILVLSDRTDFRQTQFLLAHRARHDRLTGLLNHEAFAEFLDSQCHSLSERRCEGLLLWLDLDDFRLINETASRAAGDELLVRLANQLALWTPQSGLVARLGVDEFGIWLPDARSVNARQWPQELLEQLRAARFEVAGHNLRVTASIGVCVVDYRLGADLLHDAEAACRRARHDGGNRLVWYSRDDQEIAAQRHQLATLQQLKRSLDEEGLLQAVQAIVALPLTEDSLSPRHFEVLLRLKGGDGRPQSPGQFIEAAERYRFMSEIDRWVLTHTFRRLALWGTAAPMLAINLSGATVQDPEVYPFIRKLLREYDFDPRKLCFEITETSAITHVEQALSLMGLLRSLGCQVALDDFGAGLLSFEFMRRLRPDFVKIDGKLVRDVETDPVAAVIVRAIVEVAHEMGAKTVGEWVETPSLVSKLEALRVDFIQGYYTHAPSPLTDALPQVPSSKAIAQESVTDLLRPH
ncbi:EAL domain-containing protein [Halothiobacillus sp. DCM-1]|uniref:EAL domain-containing protein n=1 Tax=Halothiobacillus sp. DCM-1 TaxID=3112558 RepID=UPI003249915C